VTGQAYEIAWTPTARKAIRKLPEKVGTAAIEFLYGPVAASPHRLGKPLGLGLERLWTARRGDYRVLYRVDDEARRVEIVTIEHRSDVYRRRPRHAGSTT
jgi:mRNA-degrading endonuclease RelE of RelBE toxin-antitoxin system